MSIFTKLFKPQPDPRGVMLEIQNSFTAFSGNAYQNAIYRAAVDAIARHVGKLMAHVQDTQQGGDDPSPPYRGQPCGL